MSEIDKCLLTCRILTRSRLSSVLTWRHLGKGTYYSDDYNVLRSPQKRTHIIYISFFVMHIYTDGVPII